MQGSLSDKSCKNRSNRHGLQELLSDTKSKDHSHTLSNEHSHKHSVQGLLSKTSLQGLQSQQFASITVRQCSRIALTTTKCMSSLQRHKVQNSFSQVQCAKIAFTNTMCEDPPPPPTHTNTKSKYHFQEHGMQGSLSQTQCARNAYTGGVQRSLLQCAKIALTDTTCKKCIHRRCSKIAITLCKNRSHRHNLQEPLLQAQSARNAHTGTVCKDRSQKHRVQGSLTGTMCKVRSQNTVCRDETSHERCAKMKHHRHSVQV